MYNDFHKYTERYKMSTISREDLLTEIATIQSLQLKFQDDNEILKELEDQLEWLLEKLSYSTEEEFKNDEYIQAE